MNAHSFEHIIWFDDAKNPHLLLLSYQKIRVLHIIVVHLPAFFLASILHVLRYDCS